MTLSQRLQDGLIGEDSEAVNAGKYANTQKRAQDDLRQEQRDRVKPTIATIEADLKGLVPKTYTEEHILTLHPEDQAVLRKHNKLVTDITAAIEHYTRGAK